MKGYELVRLQPQQVLKTGDTMSGNLTMTGGAKFIGDLQGNADSATRLQTARTINGTSFDGTANITTENWGTARDITIGNTAKPVNGSANVAWSVAEIGAVNKAGDTMTGDLTVPNLTVNGTITGNADTAARLQTARTINGTLFDGTANITTENWGTTRNITIGNTAKPVNGSGDVSWSLQEIGIVQNTDFIGPRGNWSTNAGQDLLVHGRRALVGLTNGELHLGFGGDFTDIRCGNGWTVWHSNNFDPNSKVDKVSNGNITIHADADNSSTAEFISLQAGNNRLKVMSEAGGGVGDLLTLTSGTSTYKGEVLKFSESTSWKSIDFYRESGGRQGKARYGIGANPSRPSPTIEFHTSYGSTSFQSKIDVNPNSLALVVQGDHTGDRSAWFGIYSGGSSEQIHRIGYVGRGSNGNENMVLLADRAAVQIRSAYQTSTTGVIADSVGYFRPETTNGWANGHPNYRWSTVYYTNLNAPSDKNLKENIEYIPKDDVAAVWTSSKSTKSIITENDLYDFVKNDLNLATYDYKENAFSNPGEADKMKNKIGFIAQDIKDSKVGKIFIKADETIETPDTIGGDVAEREDEVFHLPKVVSEDVKELYSYDLTDYVNIIAGALKVAMNKIEILENELSSIKV